MLNNEDITLALTSIKGEFSKAAEKDVIFVILYNMLEDKDKAYKYAYRVKGNGKERYESSVFKPLLAALEPFGLGSENKGITKEENKDRFVKLLSSVDEMLREHKIEAKDAIKLEADIRTKLNDKFNIEESLKQKRIIVVPQKHDIICKHTQRECTFWPSKEACKEHYGLKD